MPASSIGAKAGATTAHRPSRAGWWRVRRLDVDRQGVRPLVRAPLRPAPPDGRARQRRSQPRQGTCRCRVGHPRVGPGTGPPGSGPLGARPGRRGAGHESPDAAGDQDRRSVRFNDLVRTVTAQLPPTAYAEVRACLEARAKRVPSDGETPFDQRLADAFVELIRSSGRRPGQGSTDYTMLAHVPLEVLTDPTSTLCGELDHAGLISAPTVRELLCDATLIIAADDDMGHTMYEGRAFRLATDTQRRELGPPRPALPVPGVYQRALRRSTPPRGMDPRRQDGPAEPGSPLRIPPSPAPLEAVDPDRQRQRGDPLCRTRRPGPDLPPVTAVDAGDVPAWRAQPERPGPRRP